MRRGSDHTSSFLLFLASLVPEQSQRLHDLARDLDLTILLDEESEEILFSADPDKKEITIGGRCVQRMRAHACAYYFSWSSHGDQTAEHLKKMQSQDKRDEYFEPADRMLSWAVAHDVRIALGQSGRPLRLDQVMSDVGAELPPDVFASIPVEQRNLADYIAKFALAYIVFHEIAHLENGDVRREGPESIEQEKQADRLAAEWLLNAPNLSHGRRLNRLFGIAVARLWYSSLNVYLGPGQMRTHPPGYDRLYQTLCQFIDAENQQEAQAVWSFVVVSLFMHVYNRQLPYAPEQFSGDFKDTANHLIDIISRA